MWLPFRSFVYINIHSNAKNVSSFQNDLHIFTREKSNYGTNAILDAHIYTHTKPNAFVYLLLNIQCIHQRNICILNHMIYLFVLRVN